MLTEVTRPAGVPFVLQVKWTPYNGWLNLSHYEVFRSDAGGPFRYFKTMKPWQLEMYDSALCDRSYCYYVIAVSQDGLRSRSNEACERPLYVPPIAKVPVELATVFNSRSAFIRWNAYDNYVRGGRYVVHRSDRQAGLELGTTEKLNFTDFSARVNEQPYTYRISYTDHCGVKGTVSREGTTVYLTGDIRKEDAWLAWTPYSNWPAGTAGWLVQLRDADGQFRTRAILPGTVNSWMDYGVVSANSDSIVYRVLALKEGVVADTSVSNHAFLIPDSRLFVPTAFTPNGDGFNDLFGARAIFIVKGTSVPKKAFMLEIYNRWGQLVFRSNQPDEAWDGTFMGRPCPDGAYAFRVKGVGFDGKLHVTEGSVQLLR